MKLFHAVVVAVLSLGLSGCMMSEQKFTEVRAVLKKRPDLRAKVLTECIKDVSAYSREKRELLGAMMDLKPSTFPQAFCRRVEQSFVSGRMTYEDYRNISAQKPTARLIRMMRGK